MSTPKKPAVLIVGHFLSQSGGSRGVCEDLAERLGASGWNIITTSRRRGRVALLCDMVTTAWRRRHDYAVAQVDVYSGPAFVWAEVVCALLQRLGKPYVLTLHGGNLPVFARRWPVRVRRLLRSAQVVTVPSQYLQQRMSPYRADLSLLPNPLNLNSYNFRWRQQAEPRLIWLRAFYMLYNPLLAVRVLSLLVSDFPNIQLIMVGPDKGDGSLQATQQLAQQLGVTEWIDFPGSILKVQVPEQLNDADIFINTTNIDNTPVSVMEAMACGLCVVSTNVGGIPYLLDNGEDSLLVPPNDEESLAAAIRRFLNEPELAQRLSYNARQKVEGFDWTVILPKWEQLLSTAIERQCRN